MANFNKVILAGNLVTDVQYKMLPSSQTAVAEFRMAVNRKYKTQSGEQRDEAMFIDCTVFGASAETVRKFCTKGKPLLVEGRLKYDTWEDKQGGGKRSKHSVVVDNFQFLGGRDDQGGGGSYDAGQGQGYGGPGGSAGGDDYDQTRPPARAPQRPAPKAPPAEPPYGDEQQFKEDDIPF